MFVPLVVRPDHKYTQQRRPLKSEKKTTRHHLVAACYKGQRSENYTRGPQNGNESLEV